MRPLVAAFVDQMPHFTGPTGAADEEAWHARYPGYRRLYDDVTGTIDVLRWLIDAFG
jgi:hypothetical protein